MARKNLSKKPNRKGLAGALARHLLASKVTKPKTNPSNRPKLGDSPSSKDDPLKKPLRDIPLHQKFQPFKQDDKVLLVGEGDFTFAKSLVAQSYVKPENLIATSLDSEADTLSKYSGSNVQDTLKFLRDSNVLVLHDIDAQDLVGSFKLNSRKENMSRLRGWTTMVNYIVFNFPHLGTGIKDIERNTIAHQKLLAKFFLSCEDFYKVVKRSLPPQDSIPVHYTQLVEHNDDFEYDEGDEHKPSPKKANEAKDSKIIVSLFEGEPYQSWQVRDLARDSIDYKVQRSGAFYWDIYPEYHHRTTIGGKKETTRPPTNRKARMYVFEKHQRIEKARNTK
ncbi:BA75_04743T0 [Komagataella pastoris]|uniref:BA75_04743T0 n=1 Tax=Komagataella pastoris TaxID=4922 RepID=A0A1B2JII4_PICPA|nr:BA75_04743T0 [Komagataella pastoris]